MIKERSHCDYTIEGTTSIFEKQKVANDLAFEQFQKGIDIIDDKLVHSKNYPSVPQLSSKLGLASFVAKF